MNFWKEEAVQAYDRSQNHDIDETTKSVYALQSIAASLIHLGDVMMPDPELLTKLDEIAKKGE
jgi:hypothetical protein